MQRNELLEVVIETDGDGIDLRELNEFFYNFRTAYAAALASPERADALARATLEEFEEPFGTLMDGSDWRQVSHLARLDLGDLNLKVIDIRRENPLIVVFSGVLIALTAAVILSGGKMKAGPLTVKLPPLGKGIAKLRKALGRPPESQR